VANQRLKHIFGIVHWPGTAGSTIRISIQLYFRGKRIGELHILVTPDIKHFLLLQEYGTATESLLYSLSGSEGVKTFLLIEVSSLKTFCYNRQEEVCMQLLAEGFLLEVFFLLRMLKN
jgi:hypothetical protein